MNKDFDKVFANFGKFSVQETSEADRISNGGVESVIFDGTTTTSISVTQLQQDHNLAMAIPSPCDLRENPQPLEASFYLLGELLKEMAQDTNAVVCWTENETEFNAYCLFSCDLKYSELLALLREIIQEYSEFLQKGTSLVFSNSGFDTGCVGKIMTQFSLQTVIIAPLIAENVYLGQICFYQPLSASETLSITCIRLITQQCTQMMAYHRLSQQWRSLQQQQQLRQRIDPIVQDLATAEAKLTDILGVIGQYFQVDYVGLWEITAQKSYIYQEWWKNHPISAWQESDEAFQPYHWYCSDNQSMCSRNSGINGCDSGFYREIAVTFESKTGFSGRLILKTQQHDRIFCQQDIELLETVSEPLAIAIKILQLHQHCQTFETNQAQFSQTNQAKGEFLSNMAHELRTPLTGILGFARMLKDELYGKLNDKQKQYVTVIGESGEHLLSLVNDFLDFSKLEANREEISPELIAVRDMCQASIAMVESRAHEENLLLKIEIADNIGGCWADKRRLKQILLNLLSNAIKFTEKGSVTLKVEATDTQILFSVIDTGIGISLANQEKLFQPYQQISNSLTHKHKGTGLGLVLSRQFAQLHGGDLTVISQEGEGSCFTLALPFDPQKLASFVHQDPSIS